MWVFTLALLTCLCIDFSNPLLPGVVRFGEEDSVRALRAERARTDGRPARPFTRPPESERVLEFVVATPRPITRRPDPTGVPHRAAGQPRGALDAAPTSPPAAEDDLAPGA